MDKDALVHSIQILETQNGELQAQLARCVEALVWRDGGDHDTDCKANRSGDENACNCGHNNTAQVLGSLPKTVHLDAEVLRCADAWIKAKDTDMKQKDFSDYLYDIEVAARAMMEASNDNI